MSQEPKTTRAYAQQDQFPFALTDLRDFSEPIKAVAMAKCSRSTKTFREDALECTQEQAEGFQDRVINQYGHESPADMSMGSTCFEDISTLVAEDVLDIQTGKYQGKSSRYVPFSRKRIAQPFKALMDMNRTSSPQVIGNIDQASRAYQRGINALFDAYEALQGPLTTWVMAQPNMAEAKPHEVRARVFDSVRELLPLAALTNLGSRLSGRDTAELIRRLRVAGSEETMLLADALMIHAKDEVGEPLVRHCTDEGTSPLYGLWANLRHTGFPVRGLTDLGGPRHERHVKLMHYTIDPFGTLIDNLLFEADQQLSLSGVYLKQEDEVLEVVKSILATRKRRQDPVPHAFRAVRFVFEIQDGFGVWKDLRRHRRNENFRPPLFTAKRGWVLPVDVEAAGGDIQATFIGAFQLATEAWKELIDLGFDVEAQYLVAHGHIQRWRMDMDLEQLYYIGELRSAPGGHIFYRQVAAEMVELVRELDSRLVEHILVHPVEGVEIHH